MAKALTASVQGQLPLEWIALIAGQYTTPSCHGHCLWWTDEVIIDVIAMTFMKIEIVCIHVSSLKPTTRILGPFINGTTFDGFQTLHTHMTHTTTLIPWAIDHWKTDDFALEQDQYKSMFDAPQD